MRLNDPDRSLHGDFILVKYEPSKAMPFTPASHRLYNDADTALAAMPKGDLAADILVAQIVLQHRPRVIFDEVIDPREVGPVGPSE